MTQNRKKLIQLLIGNLANAVVHEILEKSIDNEELISRYREELFNSFQIAKKYREKINPLDSFFNEAVVDDIKKKIHARVKSELLFRISKGYTGIRLESIDRIIDKMLKDLNID